MQEKSICVIGDAFFDIFLATAGLEKGGVCSQGLTMYPGGTANVAVWARRAGADAFDRAGQ